MTGDRRVGEERGSEVWVTADLMRRVGTLVESDGGKWKVTAELVCAWLGGAVVTAE